uniref:RNA-directed RNA polymerase n=1 Tax=Ruddy turnstone rotavirus TaxID=2212774 RepID=A0A3G1RPP6_9REOV|nr:MAG: viral structural protein 1 [Ruddy turnstone rotavirus]
MTWLSESQIRNLAYTSLVYTNPQVTRIELEESKNENLWSSRETKPVSPKEEIDRINEIVRSSLSTDDKINKLLRIRYHGIYVDDKSDKRDTVSKLLDITIKELPVECRYNDQIDRIILDAKRWRANNTKSLRAYHFNIPINEYIRDNEIEIIDTGDKKWKSDTLMGLIPHFGHRTHTLISSVIFAVQSRIKSLKVEHQEALAWLLRKIRQLYKEGYLELERNRQWSHTISQLRDSTFRMYNAKVIHAACAAISISMSDSIDYGFLCQIVAAFEQIPANAAKLLSSPMTLFVGICQFNFRKIVSTGNANETVITELPNTRKVEKSQIDEWNELMENDPLKSSIMLQLMNENLSTDVETFKLIFNCFSATFHVGHRIDNSQDAIQDQVNAKYTSDVDREMYDQYYYMLKNMFKEEIKYYINECRKTYNSDVTVPSLASLANTSNGRSIEVKFIDRYIKTTKKMLHLDHDLSSSSNYTNVHEIISRGIPMGTRNVPARQTRGIFILPWQVAAVQHTLAETMYKRAKKGAYKGAFAEAYTAKAASLTYGVLAEDTSNANKIILYTDVSQWDASQHNTEPYRSAWINAIDEARSELKRPKSDEPHVLEMNVLDKMMDIQKALLSSNLIVESPGSNGEKVIIRYHGVASGEKTTKIGNSYANIALITTVLSKVSEQIPDLRVTHLRVDGDDNVVTAYTSCEISKLQSIIKNAYSLMNARVKALASYTGLEMAKRFIICGKIFERGAISIYTAERPYGTDASQQQIAGSLLYSSAVNAHRTLGDNYKRFMEDVLIPPAASTKVTARLRVLLSPVTLHATGPLSFEITPGGIGGRMRFFTNNDSNMQLFKTLTTSVSVSVTPDDIKLYRKTEQFKHRVEVMKSAMEININGKAKILEDILEEKESQKTLGIPNVQSQKNRDQISETLKILSLPEQKLEKVTKFYPEEIFNLVLSNSKKVTVHVQKVERLYEHSSIQVTKLQSQLGIRIADTAPIVKPINTLYEIVSKIAPFKISPSDIEKYARDYKLDTYVGKKSFLQDLGLQGAQLKQYLSTKLLFKDLLLAKYDKLYESPGFGSTQLTTIPLDIHTAKIVFNINIKLPAQYQEILLLMLLYEYIHYVMDGGETFRVTLNDMQQDESVKLASQIMKMIDNIKLDEVKFKDDIM